MSETLEKYRNVPVSVAADLLNVSQGFIRAGLQISSNKWTYQISPGLLKEYIEGSSLKNYFQENKEFLKTILEG